MLVALQDLQMACRASVRAASSGQQPSSPAAQQQPSAAISHQAAHVTQCPNPHQRLSFFCHRCHSGHSGAERIQMHQMHQMHQIPLLLPMLPPMLPMLPDQTRLSRRPDVDAPVTGIALPWSRPARWARLTPPLPCAKGCSWLP